MGRLRTITDEQILEAAREVFLEEGFGASTLEIARRAGISEGSIFKRFSTKEKLFFAAMSGAEVPDWVKRLQPLVGQGDLKENLVTLSLQILEFMHEVIPRIVMMQAKGFPAAGMDLHESPIERDTKALAAFFEAEMQLGRMRPCNPTIAASTLLGVIAHQVMLEHQCGSSKPPNLLTPFVRELVELLWQGIAPA